MSGYSEFSPVRTILLQPPFEVQPVAMSVFMGAEKPYLPRRANQEVHDFIALLKRQGVEVVTLREALLRGTLDEEGRRVEGRAMSELIAMALDSISCADAQRLKLAQESIPRMHPADLINLIFEQPELRLVQDPEIAKISPDAYYEKYETWPLFGLMYVRDHFIITNKGVIMSYFRREDRRRESRVVALGLRNLGIEPVYDFAGESFLEGGDFATTSTVSFIANGLRTERQTIQKLMDLDLYGTDYVVEFFDLLRIPAQFHLDHYFNILDDATVAVAKERLSGDALRATLFRRTEAGYVEEASQLTVPELAERLGLRVVAVQSNEMALNFLNGGGGRLYGSERLDEGTKRQFEELGFTVEIVPFDEMHKQFGSIHCATQTIRRHPVQAQRSSQAEKMKTPS